MYELLTASRNLRGAISAGADLETIQTLQHEQEETTLLAEGIRLAEAGKTSLEEIIRVAFFD